MATLYNLTQSEAKTLLEACDNDVAKLGLVLWDRGKAISIESGVKRAKRLARFASK